MSAGYQVLQGDCRAVLRGLADDSIHACISSPPYFGLRSYGGEPQVWGGLIDCEHQWGPVGPDHHPGQVEQTKWQTAQAAGHGQTAGSGQFCSRCGAWLGHLGLEPSPQMFVEHIVEVFREVRRVLHPSGTLWLNLGDSYAGNRGNSAEKPGFDNKAAAGHADLRFQGGGVPTGLKPKDLMMIPARVALALQADGWYLRSDIIWFKTAPMPESVTDRPTKAHEYVFLLTKSADYFYDHVAVMEPSLTPGDLRAVRTDRTQLVGRGGDESRKRTGNPTGLHRNRRSVWKLGPDPYPGAHFAVMPSALVEPCIKAGTSEYGCCAGCLAPYERVTEKTRSFQSGSGRSGRDPIGKNGAGLQGGGETRDIRRGPVLSTITAGWQPTCKCNAAVEPCTVLDPFAGSGTVAQVAMRLGRASVSIELNESYISLIHKRLHGTPLPLDFREEMA